MALVFSYQGLVDALESELSTFNTYSLHLYTGSHTPAASDVASDYTSIECTFAGYMATGITFNTAFLNGSNLAESDADPETFTCTGSGSSDTLGGYFVLNGSGDLEWAEEYTGTAFNFDAPGKFATINLVMTKATA